MKQSYAITEHQERLSPIRDVVLFGLGPIGRSVGRLVTARPDLRLIGGVDIAPALVGQPLAEVLQISGEAISGEVVVPEVVSDIGKLPQGHPHAVAIQTTGSHLAIVAPQMKTLLEAGYHVISSTEEATFPSLRTPDLAAEIHQTALRCKRCVVGTGINPGFVMDLLPLFLSAPCATVRAVRVERVVNASVRREPLQRKIGSGMTPETFESLAQEGQVGHVGLLESLAFLSTHLGLQPDRVVESLEPVIAERSIQTGFVTVEPGQVRGIHHQAWAYKGNETLIHLRLLMALEEPESYDRVWLDSDPPVTVCVEGGYHGDRATAAMLVNLVVPITQAHPGWRSVTELRGLGCRPSPIRWGLPD